MDLLKQAVRIPCEPKHTRWIAPCLILAEVLLCGLIIYKVPYTEIDYTTYIIQAKKFLNGERNYRRIYGPSGPLVYPAIHVYIYSALCELTTSQDTKITAAVKGEAAVNLGLAQLIFAGLYIVTLAVVLKCYRNINAPPWLLGCLVLSKRMHSIFLLRMFNDAWATFAFWLSILLLQQGRGYSRTLGALVWSLGVGIKMTVLLATPAVAIVLLQSQGVGGSVATGLLCVLTHILAAAPFLMSPFWREYITRAFDFGRAFLFKWTVNWRWVGEETFLSKEFAVSLMIVHVSLLVLFLHWKWVRISSRGLPEFLQKCMNGEFNGPMSQISARVTPTFVMDSMLGSVIVGLLCARSLHYQFYAYLGWASPYLLWRASSNPVWVILNCALQEYCWLVFPSTSSSSLVVVIQLALQAVSILSAPLVDHISLPKRARKQLSS